MNEHPVQLVVEDDLRRSRLTVFFRLLLAIPHFVWVFLWAIAVFFAAIANWVATLAAGKPPGRCTASCASTSATSTHLNAYLWLVANPYPGFVGEEGEYPVDVKLPPPAEQDRAGRRSCGSSSRSRRSSSPRPRRRRARSAFRTRGRRRALRRRAASGALSARLRVPRLVRDPRARTHAEGPARRRRLQHRLRRADARLRPARHRPLPERRPDGDARRRVERPPQHQVYLVGDAHDLRHSRVLVFFRLPLAIPHLVWLVALDDRGRDRRRSLNWFATLFTGHAARGLPPLPLARTCGTRCTSTRSSISRRTRSRASPASRAATRSTSCSPSRSGRTAGSPASGSSSRSRRSS